MAHPVKVREATIDHIMRGTDPALISEAVRPYTSYPAALSFSILICKKDPVLS